MVGSQVGAKPAKETPDPAFSYADPLFILSGKTTSFGGGRSELTLSNGGRSIDGVME